MPFSPSVSVEFPAASPPSLTHLEIPVIMMQTLCFNIALQASRHLKSKMQEQDLCLWPGGRGDPDAAPSVPHCLLIPWHFQSTQKRLTLVSSPNGQKMLDLKSLPSQKRLVLQSSWLSCQHSYSNLNHWSSCSPLSCRSLLAFWASALRALQVSALQAHQASTLRALHASTP